MRTKREKIGNFTIFLLIFGFSLIINGCGRIDLDYPQVPESTGMYFFGEDTLREFGKSSILLPDSTILTVGNFSLKNGEKKNAELLVMKSDLRDKLIWKRTYGGELNDYGKIAVLLSDENILSIGMSKTHADTSRQDNDLWLMTLTSDGDSLDSKMFNFGDDEWIQDWIRLENGNLLLLGNSEIIINDSDTSNCYYLFETNEKCDSIASWIFPLDDKSFSSSLVQTEDGETIISGRTGVKVITTDGDESEEDFLFLDKLDENMNRAKVIGVQDTINVGFGRIIKSNDGNYLVVGSHSSYSHEGFRGTNGRVAKLDSDLNLIWQKYANVEVHNYLVDIARWSDNEYALVGWCYLGNRNTVVNSFTYTYYINIINSDGESLQKYTGTYDEWFQPMSVLRLGDKNCLITGIGNYGDRRKILSQDVGLMHFKLE